MKKFFGFWLLMLGLILAGCSDDKMSLRLDGNGVDGLNGNTLTVVNMDDDKTVEIPLTGITGEVSVSVSYDPSNDTPNGWLLAEAVETVTRATDSDWKVILKISAYHQENSRKAQVAITSGDETLILSVVQVGIADQVEMVVVCEGQFGNGTGALSTIKYNGEGSTDIFQNVNNKPLGDVAQSITYLDGKYFVVLNNSQQIKVINPITFKWENSINYEQTASPRFIARLNDREALVSDYNKQLVKIDYKEYKIVEYIPISTNIEKMTRVGDNIFGATYDAGVFMYDANNFKPQSPKVIPVEGLMDKAEMVEDKNGNLWVMGTTDNGEKLKLYCIDATSGEINQDASFILPVQKEGDAGYKEGCITGFPNSWLAPGRMDSDAKREKLYILVHVWSGENKSADAIFTFDVGTRKLEHNTLIPGVQTLYGMGVSPAGDVYITDCLGWSITGGYLRRYKNDQEVAKYDTGLFPCMVHFTEYNK